MKKAKTLFFQGDLGLLKLPDETNIPSDFKVLSKETKGLVLAYGEASGHAHAFRETENATVYFNPANDNDERGFDEMYIILKEPTILYHEEHDPILVPAGVWKKWNQKAYLFENEYEMVAD